MKSKTLIKTVVVLGALVALSACTPARVAGDVAIGAGQVVLTAADLVI